MHDALVCTICGKPYQGKGEYYCAHCGASIEAHFPLTAHYDEYRRILQSQGEGVWHYRPLLPVHETATPITLGEGNTPLVHAKNLEKELGCGPLYLKNETLNPSGSYKDRFATVAVTLEKARGASAVALGSAGNAAAAVSAYAAGAALPCYVFLPTGAVQQRALQIMAYGARLIRITGTIDDCIRMAYQGEALFKWVNLGTAMRFHPLGCEGYKTISYELGRQLDFAVPDWIVCPVGGGSLISKIYKGYADMAALGLVDHLPKFAAVQAEGCAPLVRAFREGKRAAQRWENPDTIAFAIADVDTFESATVLHILKTTGGAAEAVDDAQILSAMRLIAQKEGILAEPASATTVAGLKKLLHNGTIKRGDSVVCIISGSAMRDLELMTSNMATAEPIYAGDEAAVAAMVSRYRQQA